MYKKAAQIKLRFVTPVGNLSTEQLCDLNQTQLANSIKAVKRILKKSDDDELSFLEESKTVDVENQLRFDILKDIYLTKKADSEALRDAAGIKAHNQKLMLLLLKSKKAN